LQFFRCKKILTGYDYRVHFVMNDGGTNMRMDLLVANMRSWFHGQHFSSEAFFGAIILAIAVVALLLFLFKPPKV